MLNHSGRRLPISINAPDSIFLTSLIGTGGRPAPIVIGHRLRQLLEVLGSDSIINPMWPRLSSGGVLSPSREGYVRGGCLRK